jgi:hypothetical protein
MMIMCVWAGAFRLYDVDNDGYITRDEMYNIVEAIYQMVVSIFWNNSQTLNGLKLTTSFIIPKCHFPMTTVFLFPMTTFFSLLT